MVIEKTIKKMGEVQPGKTYLEVSGRHLVRLADCARRMDEPDLSKTLVRILDEAIQRDDTVLITA